MKILSTLLIVFLLLSGQGLAQTAQLARGTVYHDLNANGRMDSGEPGIPMVSITNGRQVVQTGADGRYEITVTDDTIISVIKPSNFMYPVNDMNLPQFFYIHKPNGSPELRYKGVAPTGALPSAIDFPLLSGRVNDEFSIVAFGDPQPYNLDEVGYYDMDIVNELVGTDLYDFGISLGDLVGDNLDLFEPLNKATSRIGLPWFHVLGNHDINFDVQEQHHADETFERVYGPANFAFNHGKVHFIILDDVIYPNPYGTTNYVGGFRDEQFEFIENTLKFVPEDYLVVFNVHIPIFNEFPFGETFLDEHRRRLFELLKNRPHTLSLSGHTHTQRHHFFRDVDGWMQEKPHHHFNIGTTSGDWWSGAKNPNGIPDALMRDGTPNGYALLHFKGNQYTFDYKVAGMPKEHKMRIYGPDKVPQNARYRGQLYVNFFQGSEFCKVDYRIDDGEWRSMRYSVGEDPKVSEIRHMWDRADVIPSGTRPSNPALSYHLWRGSIPTRLDLGTRKVEVRVTDLYGREYRDFYEFEVVLPPQSSN